jgi:hypothetical protein
VLAQNHFGRAPADVHHQATLIGLRQQVRHTQVNEPGLFAPGNHFDRKPQNLFGLDQKHIPVAGLAQSLGRHSPDLLGLEARNPFAKAGQALPAPCHGVFAQVAFAVQAAALAHGFLDVFHAPELACIHLSDLKAKTVGAQVNGGVKGMGLHGVGARAARANGQSVNYVTEL